MKKTGRRILIAALAALVLAGVTAYAVTNYGSESDPLITKSYLDSVVQPKLEAELGRQMDEAEQEMQSSTPGEFTELSLKAGQSLTCTAGSEFLLRSGSAKSVGSLADTTGGGSVSAGAAITANHLYMAAENGGGLTASANAVVLVSGSYSLG